LNDDLNSSINLLEEKPNRMKQLILFCAGAIFLLAGCSKEQLIERKEDKLIGAWEFDKAFYKEDRDIFRENIIHDFDNDIIEFYPDYSAVYDDYSLRAVFDGFWEVVVDDDYFDGESDLEFFVNMGFYDYINNEAFGYFASITQLTRNRLKIRAHNNRGVFTFKLRRIH